MAVLEPELAGQLEVGLEFERGMYQSVRAVECGLSVDLLWFAFQLLVHFGLLSVLQVGLVKWLQLIVQQLSLKAFQGTWEFPGVSCLHQEHFLIGWLM